MKRRAFMGAVGCAGACPLAELRVVQPAKFELAINLTTAKSWSLIVSAALYA